MKFNDEAQPISISYLLTYFSFVEDAEHPMMLKFGSLNEVYHFVTEEKLDKFKIEKMVRTLVTERT